MTDLAAATREALAALAHADRTLLRFGAAQHRYELAPPLGPATLAAIERQLGELPDDLRVFATTIGSGGAGPYYGWLPVERAARFVYAAPAGVTAWSRALPVAHLGCGYAAVVALDGSARGEVWIDARQLRHVAPIRPTFTAFYLDWIDRLARAMWPDSHVPFGACAMAGAIGGYLGVCEHRLGVPAGTLAGTPLRDALAELGTASIQIAAEGPLALFAPGERVDPCIACARLLEQLAADGLSPGVVAPGLLPLPLR